MFIYNIFVRKEKALKENFFGGTILFGRRKFVEDMFMNDNH